METAVISAFAENLASMLADKLFKEVSLVIDFKDDFEFICEEVNSIKSLLNDARGKAASNSIANWVDKVQDFLYDAVYLVEECEDRKFHFRNVIFRYQMGGRIRVLKKRIKQIHNSAKYLKYVTSVLDADFRLHCFNAYDLAGQDNRRKPSAILNRCQSYAGGRDDEIDKITDWILKDGNGVFAVVGMGGLGKSYMVQYVFTNPMVLEGFDHLVWLTVSPKFLVKELLLVTGRQYLKLRAEDAEGHKMSKLTDEELAERINKHLEGKRCLFVLDDVWDGDAWEKIGLQLPSDSKIVVTTRNRNVAKNIGHRSMGARHALACEILDMKCLNFDDSWKLFCAHANFPSIRPQESDQLTRIAERIVHKCGGLPLAVKTIAASMARLRRVPNEWESILDNLNALDPQNEGEGHAARVIHSLRLSYQALPARLKPCFLYCSAFPPLSHIKAEYLVHVWIAEGLLSTSTRDAGDAIELGRSYIEKLINLCMIEISRVVWDGHVKYCRLHQFLHNLALLESSKESKCLLEPGKELKEVPMDKCKGVRRISLIKNEISAISEAIPCPGLRTLLLWNNTELKSIPERFFDNLTYLVVLDLSQTCIESLPKSIGKAKHLKLLNLSETKIRELPESLSGLKHLQFLDVSGCENLNRLHSGIGGHKYLLHLNVKGCTNLTTLPAGISKLIYLRTLKGAVVVKRDQFRRASAPLQWRYLRGMTRLQSLSLTIDAQSSSSSSDLEGTFKCMANMRNLSFRNQLPPAASSSGFLRLPEDTESMERLEKLRLYNCTVPIWMFKLQNLVVLAIEGNNDSAEYKGLQKIPNLKKLRLSHNENCRMFPKEFEEAEAFPKLEKLMIADFPHLENFPNLEEEKGAMPMLKHLLMKNCKLMEQNRQVLHVRDGVIVEGLPKKVQPIVAEAETNAPIVAEAETNAPNAPIVAEADQIVAEAETNAPNAPNAPIVAEAETNAPNAPIVAEADQMPQFVAEAETNAPIVAEADQSQRDRRGEQLNTGKSIL